MANVNVFSLLEELDGAFKRRVNNGTKIRDVDFAFDNL